MLPFTFLEEKGLVFSMTYRLRLAMMTAATRAHQTSGFNGVNILNILWALESGRLVRMPSPSSMKGLVKSITLSLVDVIEIGPIPISAS